MDEPDIGAEPNVHAHTVRQSRDVERALGVSGSLAARLPLASRSRRALGNVGAAGVARLVSLVTMILSVPLAVGYLGPERYGVWLGATALAALLSFGDLGLGNGLTNAISEAMGRNDPEDARRSVASAFFMLVTASGLIAVVLIPAWTLVPWADVLGVRDQEIRAEVSGTVLVLLALSLASLPLGVAQRIQMGYQELHQNSLWSSAGAVAGLGGLMLGTSLRLALPWLVLLVAGAPVVALAANAVVLFWRRRPYLRPSLQRTDRSRAGQLMRVGSAFLVLQVCVGIAYTSDPLIAASVLGPEAATQYSVPWRLFGLGPMAVSLLLVPLWPAYAEAIARGDTGWVRRWLVGSSLIAFVVTAVSSLVLLFGAPLIIDRWIGPPIPSSFELRLGMALWAVLSSVFASFSTLLNAATLMRFQVVTSVLMAGTSIGLSYVFAHWFGVAGVIWGTVAAYVVFSAIPTVLYMPRALARIEQRARTAARVFQE